MGTVKLLILEPFFSFFKRVSVGVGVVYIGVLVLGSHSIVNKTRVMRLIVKVVRVVIKATGLVLSHEFFLFCFKR